MVQLRKPSVVALTESWLKSSLPDSVFTIPGYTLFRSDRVDDRRGGGVCIYVKTSVVNTYKVTVLKESVAGIDGLWLKIKSQAFTVHFATVYRPPSTSQAKDIALLSVIERASQKYENLILTGDFNFPSIDWHNLIVSNSTDSAGSFANMVLSTNLSQLVSRPTRLRHGQQPSLLDLILVNEEDLVSNVEYGAPIGRSDHITLHIKTQFCTSSSPRTLLKSVTTTDYTTLNEILQQTSWNEMYRLDSVETKWQYFLDVVQQAVNRVSRTFQVKCCREKPWIDNTFLERVRIKRKLWDKYGQTSSLQDYRTHRKYSNKLSEDLKTARANYENGLINKGPKSIYKHVRSCLSAKVSVPIVRKNGGDLCGSDEETADQFANYFELCFSQEPSGPLPAVTTPCNHSALNNVLFSEERIRQQITKLKADASPGPDKLSTRLLQACVANLVQPLQHIFQFSFDTATLPSAWLLAACTPIFKKGDKLDVTNYRPVSVLSAGLKIMEKIIVEDITSFALDHNIISGTQHGFLPGRSTVTNVLTCLNDWTLSLDKNIPVDVIYLDLSKAFDRVPKNRLIAKLNHMGISGRLLDWITAYLTDRSFYVKSGHTVSSHKSVLSGVPQGSCLGPILFNLYVSDLSSLLNLNHASYADDIKIYGNPLSDGQLLMHDLRSIETWCSAWLLPLNASKCSVLHLGHNNPHHLYTLCDVPLKSVTSQVDLGITISSDLKWSDHVAVVAKKANTMAYLLSRAFRQLSCDMFAKLFKTYVRPILEYGAVIWSPNLKKDIHCLEGVQRRATRGVRGIRPLAYEERLSHLKLSSLSDRRKRGDLIITYRIIHNHFDSDMDSLYSFNTDERLRGHSLKLSKEKFHTTSRQQFLSNRVFSDWNTLTDEIVTAPTLNAFKNRLDAMLRSEDL